MALDAEATPMVGLSSGLVVVLNDDGLHLAPDSAELGPIGLGELMLLERLALGRPPTDSGLDEIVAASGVERTRLDDTFEALRAHGLLTDRPTMAAPESQSSATTPQTIHPGKGDRLVIPTPLALRVTASGYQYLDHDGRLVLTLEARELAAASVMCRPLKRLMVFNRHQRACGPSALDQDEFKSLLRRLEEAGVTRRITENDQQMAANRNEREWRRALENLQLIGDSVDERLTAYEDERPAVASTNGLDRVDIVGVHPHGPCPPLAIAMVMAFARDYEGGKLQDRFDFFPRWLMGKDRLPRFGDKPAIYLFSNYLWSTATNLQISNEVKAQSPGSLVIHGGPDTPKYESDAEQFFADNPQIDITVRGEGEATMAELLEALVDVEFFDDRVPDLSPLRDVPGLCYRDGDRVVRTEDRDRIADVDLIPSPYLTGTLEPYTAAHEDTAIIETNRGCPYGCTFCDWGSATLSRIRKFDLDRIFGELEWCAKNEVARVWLADANFGIFQRDVEIAEKVAELKAEYGYPKVFATNYAKNTVKHLKHIVKVMADAGILTEGLLSLQSMDEGTLKTIKRSNIKLEKYEDLAKEFRAANLPLYIDLMLGLPGATLDGFRNDLQQCLDREVNARIFATTLLVNSPMNEPSYKEENQIETEVMGGIKQKLVVSTSSFTRTDFDAMQKLREIYIMCENHGILRQLSRFVRQDQGLREVDLYEALWRSSMADRDRWPAMSFVFETGPSLMVPPVSWRLFIDEVRTYLLDEVGMTDDSALQTAVDVQLALLPSRNRAFPDVLELSHDFGAWHAQMIEAKDEGHLADWPDVVPRLGDMPPAHFPIDDPNQVCVMNIGYHVEGDIYSDWELRSPVARSMPATHLAT
jgi:radical SAM superfamily enzyme YgiQ (UPF0313 family)